MSKKRSAVRRDSSIPATIAADNVEIGCTIVDISEFGARLRLPPGYILSSFCYIRSPELGKGVASRIVWRRKNELGVRFR